MPHGTSNLLTGVLCFVGPSTRPCSSSGFKSDFSLTITPPRAAGLFIPGCLRTPAMISRGARVVMLSECTEYRTNVLAMNSTLGCQEYLPVQGIIVRRNIGVTNV